MFAGNHLNIVALCDYGAGDKTKIERLRQSQILKAGRVLTAADFSGKVESDVEDLFDAGFYCDLVSRALGLKKGNVITPETAAKADANTQRIVKQVEAACRILPPDTPDFGHFVPANWLLRHPDLLDGNGAPIATSLDRFEQMFKAINALL